MLSLSHVSKHYRHASGDVRALDDVSLEVAGGEFVAVRGPSGCGKSTLLAIVGGLTSPTAGRVEVDGAEVSALGPAGRAAFRAARVGFVFQMFHLLPYLDVRQNVLLAAEGGGNGESGARAEELLERFGLGHRLRHRPGELSAGERQRVAMARSLLNEPKLLLADEPTGNLDPASAGAVLDLLADFHAAGGTVLLVTHDERAAGRAERTLHLKEGRLDAAAGVA